jgi:hypothetical protein
MKANTLLAFTALSFCMASPVRADLVTATVAADGGSFFLYSLTVTAQTNTIIGVNVVNGSTVFNLNPSSPINAPANWLFIAPLGGPADALSYVATMNSAYITPTTNNPLGGFSFDSSVGNVKTFSVTLVTLTGTEAVTVTTAPEPALLIPVGLTLGLIAVRGLRRSAAGVQ